MSKPSRSRIKACDHCKVESAILFRIVHDQAGKWIMACENCRAAVQDNPSYRYGGTWKANKRH